MSLFRKLYVGIFLVFAFSTASFPGGDEAKSFKTLSKEDISDTAQHLNHYKTFSKICLRI